LNRDREFGVLMGKRRGTGKPGRNDNHPMKNSRTHLAALLALLCLGIGLSQAGFAAPAKPARKVPATRSAAIALIADRHVEEADIRRAALVLERDPLRKTGHAAWRKKLLDLCVDRELLAMVAER